MAAANNKATSTPPKEGSLMWQLFDYLDMPQANQRRLFEDRVRCGCSCAHLRATGCSRRAWLRAQVFTWQDWNKHRNTAWRHRFEPMVL